MKESIKIKLRQLLNQYEFINKELLNSNIYNKYEDYKKLLIKKSKLDIIINLFNQYQTIKKDIKEFKILIELYKDDIKEITNIKKEILNLNIKKNIGEEKIEKFFLITKKQEININSIYLEIRAATGGKEAAIFAGDLFKMYSKYATYNKWFLEIISYRPCDYGGFKEIISKIEGKDVYNKMKFESGVHRVQRIPNTETQGRLHTSTCTVAILQEVKNNNTIIINSKDIRIDTFRASGAGGQHVNKTDSAVRIFHIPSNITVECQNERSQHKNKSHAMSILKSKLLQVQLSNQQKKQIVQEKF